MTRHWPVLTLSPDKEQGQGKGTYMLRSDMSKNTKEWLEISEYDQTQART